MGEGFLRSGVKFEIMQDEEFDFIGEFFFFVVVEEFVSLEDVELVWEDVKFDDINFLDLQSIDFFGLILILCLSIC